MKKEVKEKELYKTETKLDFNEFKKYNKEVYKTLRKGKVLSGLITFAVVYSLIVFHNREITLTLIISIIIGMIIGIPIGMLLVKLLQSIKIKSTYKMLEKHSKESLNTIIYFYKDYLVQESSISTYKLEYNKIYKIIDTEDNFYIMINDRQGLVIFKKNCTEELINFIEEIENNN